MVKVESGLKNIKQLAAILRSQAGRQILASKNRISWLERIFLLTFNLMFGFNLLRAVKVS